MEVAYGLRGLEVRNVSVRYFSARRRRGSPEPEGVAVDDVSLRLEPTQTLALLGPSGCGKSSLLRAIAGLEPLASGAILWNGQDLARVPPHQRGFGLLFQDGQLFPHRNVARNISYGLEASGIPRAERAQRIAELLELVGLTGYGERAITELSGGQRQRVALARALAPRPRLLSSPVPGLSTAEVCRGPNLTWLPSRR